MTESDAPPPAAGRYRIGAVAQATGLTTHTIRVWERRYQAVHPQRTPGGDRLYSDGDIARLRLLKRLQQAGHGIGTIARLPEAELESILARHHPERRLPADNGGVPLDTLRRGFLEAVGRLDAVAADRVLATAAGTLPSRVLVYDFLAPVLEEIGARWEAGQLEIAHEHAASAALREHIAVVMRVQGGVYASAHAGAEAAAPGSGAARRVVITTPAGELHEFGALLTAVLAAVSGWEVHYLGPNLPAAEIVRAALGTGARLVLLSWVCAEPDATLAELQALRTGIPASVRVLVGGRALREAPTLPAGVLAVPDLAELERLLRD